MHQDACGDKYFKRDTIFNPNAVFYTQKETKTEGNVWENERTSHIYGTRLQKKPHTQLFNEIFSAYSLLLSSVLSFHAAYVNRIVTAEAEHTFSIAVYWSIEFSF